MPSKRSGKHTEAIGARLSAKEILQRALDPNLSPEEALAYLDPEGNHDLTRIEWAEFAARFSHNHAYSLWTLEYGDRIRRDVEFAVISADLYEFIDRSKETYHREFAVYGRAKPHRGDTQSSGFDKVKYYREIGPIACAMYDWIEKYGQWNDYNTSESWWDLVEEFWFFVGAGKDKREQDDWQAPLLAFLEKIQKKKQKVAYTTLDNYLQKRYEHYYPTPKVGATKKQEQAEERRQKANAKRIAKLEAKDPVVAIMDELCPEDVWWRLAQRYPYHATISPCFKLYTFIEPDRWMLLEKDNASEWFAGTCRLLLVVTTCTPRLYLSDQAYRLLAVEMATYMLNQHNAGAPRDGDLSVVERILELATQYAFVPGSDLTKRNSPQWKDLYEQYVIAFGYSKDYAAWQVCIDTGRLDSFMAVQKVVEHAHQSFQQFEQRVEFDVYAWRRLCEFLKAAPDLPSPWDTYQPPSVGKGPRKVTGKRSERGGRVGTVGFGKGHIPFNFTDNNPTPDQLFTLRIVAPEVAAQFDSLWNLYVLEDGRLLTKQVPGPWLLQMRAMYLLPREAQRQYAVECVERAIPYAKEGSTESAYEVLLDVFQRAKTNATREADFGKMYTERRVIEDLYQKTHKSIYDRAHLVFLAVEELINGGLADAVSTASVVDADYLYPIYHGIVLEYITRAQPPVQDPIGKKRSVSKVGALQPDDVVLLGFHRHGGSAFRCKDVPPLLEEDTQLSIQELRSVFEHPDLHLWWKMQCIQALRKNPTFDLLSLEDPARVKDWIYRYELGAELLTHMASAALDNANDQRIEEFKYWSVYLYDRAIAISEFILEHGSSPEIQESLSMAVATKIMIGWATRKTK